MTTPEFNIPPSVLTGDRSDVQSQRTQTILRSENVSPDVTLEFCPDRSGVLCGIEEVRVLLEKVLPETGIEVWALSEGREMAAGEVALRIKAAYSVIGLYEMTICGILAASSGWATAARECVNAAGSVPVVCTVPAYAHPNVVPLIDYAAVTGGCVAVSSMLGARLAGVTPAGYMQHALPLLLGDTVKALQSYDRHLPLEIPRIAIIDTFKDEAEEAVNVARAFRDRLRGVNLSTPAERGGVTPGLVKEIRAKLDAQGFQHVDIFVTHGANKDTIRRFIEENAPVSGFSVDEAIGGAPPLGFNAEIHEIDGAPVARRGRMPGITPSPRLDRIM